MDFKQYRLLLETLPGVDPDEEQDIIKRSFDKVVISDILASASVSNFDWHDCDTCPTKSVCDASVRNNLVPSQSVIDYLQARVPSIDFDKYINISDEVDRVQIRFQDGPDIHVPPYLNSILGPVILLHEVAHKLYSIDILTNDIIKHKYASAIFTLARTIEDARIEKLMEQDYPSTVNIFKERAKYIIPLYKKHSPSEFAKIVDQLFLYLRGYSPKFPFDPALLKPAQDFMEAGNNRERKVQAVIELGELIGEH